MDTLSGFAIIAWIAVLIQSFLLFLFFFEPYLPYKIRKRPVTVKSEEFLNLLETLANTPVHQYSHVTVLPNGEVYFEAELEAIAQAEYSINLEAYIFQKGKVTERLIKALAERARLGVKVNVLLDAIGSFATTNGYFKDLTEAGGEVEWYHPFRWYTLPRFNNRTHRELIIVDGKVGFIGGSGFADHWLYRKGKNERWRDTMFRVDGDAVKSLQSVFAENWLEAHGEILTERIYFPATTEHHGEMTALIISSSPSAGRSTRARVLYQTLLASARESIYITSPYFLPDRSAREEMIRAIQRGVDLKIITPGNKTDHLLTRHSSRRLYGDLLKAGGKIFEYEPAMLHTKSMLIDRLWSVVGSTNFDHRSFGLNDEVNLVVCNQQLARDLLRDFQNDLSDSREISYAQWRRRSIFERLHEAFGWILERQQ